MHLEAGWHLFGYLKRHPDFALAIDATEFTHPFETEIEDETLDITDDFRIYQGTTVDDGPMVKLMEDSEMKLTAYVDAGLSFPYSTTGYLILWGSTPIAWESKKQKSSNASTYASEFLAIGELTRRLIEFRYLLRSLGAMVSQPALTMEDNMSVVNSSTLEKTTLKARHVIANYHTVREGMAAGVLKVIHVSSEENLADIFTKALNKVTFLRLANAIRRLR
jgi:hypothetical protein